jgi:DNA-binding NarL/FixJ family response regulator
VTAVTALRVLVVGRDPLTRAGLAAILASARDLTVAGQIEAAADLASTIAVFQPDVVLWDLGWADDDARAVLAAALDSVASGEAPLPIVALLAEEANAAAVWQTGVRGVLSRSAPIGAVSAALSAAAQGLVVGEPRLTLGLVEPRSAPAVAPREPLTPREQEVLTWMAQGYANKAIARQLRITEHTVKFHVNAVLDKLGAQSRTEAVVMASRAGLILL